MSRSALAVACALLLAACGGGGGNGPSTDGATDGGVAGNVPDGSSNGALGNTLDSDWGQAGAARVAQAPPVNTRRGAARNVILFVGDGMGLSTETATRIFAGQQLGGSGEEHVLSFEALPYAGLSRTYTVDEQTADSAATMSAMMTGVKTDSGLIGLAERGSRGRCGSVPFNEMVSALRLAELGGRATGIVTTTRLTHATPAATYAVSAERDWEDDSDMPARAIEGGCEDIASQFVAFEARLEALYPGVDVDGIEIALGGGRRHFLPAEARFNSDDTLSEIEGDRLDGRNLVQEWQSLYPNGRVAYDEAGFDAFDPESDERLLGLFSESHMQFEQQRFNDVGGEPSLAEMTDIAIRRLDNDEQGYFLVVEAGRIDHAHHVNSAEAALQETLALADAVTTARQLVSEDTLLIVTADHGHVFTLSGFAARGNPILGLVRAPGSSRPSLAGDGLPYTTLAYRNGLGFRDLDVGADPYEAYQEGPDAGRKDLSSVDTTSSGFHGEVLVPLPAETHSGEDVAIHAQGPGASLLQGTNEQHVIFHVMEHAADLVGRAEAVLERR